MGIVEQAWTIVFVVCSLTFGLLNCVLAVNGIFSAAVVLVILYFAYDYATSPLRECSHIPGPEGARHFIGHLDMMIDRGQVFVWIHELSKKCGKVFRVHLGRQTQIYVTDLEMVKEVFVTQFHDHFHSRPPIPTGPFKSRNLFAQLGEDWRSSRRALNGSFNSRNLTYFAESMNVSGREVVARVGQIPVGKPFDIFKFFGSVTLQVIAATSFGRYIPQDGSSSDKLTGEINKILRAVGQGSRLALYIQTSFPFMFDVMAKLPIPAIRGMMEAADYISQQTDSMAEQLRKGEVGDLDKMRKSFLGLLLNAKDKETGRTLEQDEIQAQSLLFMIAGYETTANTLAFMFYEFARNPDVQKKVQEEIDTVLANESDEIGYGDISKLQYLDWCIHETLRLFPPLSVMTRQTFKDTEIGGYDIPVGTKISIPTWTIHRDPTQYANPNEFTPERWDPTKDEQKNRHPMAWHPFGEGPRKCIGYRFALQELKIISVNLLKRYSFVLDPQMEVPIKIRQFSTIAPHDGVSVVAAGRD